MAEEKFLKLGEKASLEFFQNRQAKELFQKTCDLWYAYKIDIGLPFNYSTYIAAELRKEIDDLLSLCYGASSFFDTTYCERVWVQQQGAKDGEINSLFYYDCFYHCFIAFGENKYAMDL